jgi:hypothetical protein
MNFIFLNETPLSLLINMESTPNIGVKSKDDNNIYKTKRINTSISYRMIMYQLYF